MTTTNVLTNSITVLTLCCVMLITPTCTGIGSIEADSNSISVNVDVGGDVSVSVGGVKESLVQALSKLSQIDLSEISKVGIVDNLDQEVLTPGVVSQAVAKLAKIDPAVITSIKAAVDTIGFRETDGVYFRPLKTQPDDISEGVGISIAVTPPLSPEERDAGQSAVFAEAAVIDQFGRVGLGVSDPTERLSVRGNIRATGDCTCDGVNLNERVQELTQQVDDMRVSLNRLKQPTSFATCNEAYESSVNASVDGSATSGFFTLHPELNGDTFVVWCEFADDGVWTRVGSRSNKVYGVGSNVDDENLDVELVTTTQIEMLTAMAKVYNGFSEYKASCDVFAFAKADDSVNSHSFKYFDISEFMTSTYDGDINGKGMVMGAGSDSTYLSMSGGTCSPGRSDDGRVTGCTPPEKKTPAACTTIWCTTNYHGVTACGRNGKPTQSSGFADIMITSIEFRPRSGSAHANQWFRNQYRIEGQEYYVYFK